MVKPWRRSNFLLSLWIELRFCMHQDMISVAGGKILLAKTNWFFHPKNQLFQNLNYIVCALLATQHARCHKEYYSPRGQAVSTSHVFGGDSRQRSQFAILSTISSQERRVFSKFHDFHVPRLHHGKPWASSIFFAQPMDRAEVLHTASHTYVVRWKIGPIKNDWVEPREFSTFL